MKRDPITRGIIEAMRYAEQSNILALDTMDIAKASGDRALILALESAMARLEEANSIFAFLAGIDIESEDESGGNAQSEG